MFKVPESRVADFLASRDELWQNAEQYEKDFAISVAKAKLEAENEKRKKAEAQARKDEMIAYTFYKMRLGEKL